jgi:hypothetical protein
MAHSHSGGIDYGTSRVRKGRRVRTILRPLPDRSFQQTAKRLHFMWSAEFSRWQNSRFLLFIEIPKA